MVQISVALCTFNGALYLREQLESILTQTKLPAEIVISDDCSTDQTLEIIEIVRKEQLELNPNINYISFQIIKNSASLGVTKNFEQALRLCNYPLISLCDQDDIWLPKRLETLSRCFVEDEELLLVFTNSDLIDKNSTFIGTSAFEALKVSHKEYALVAKGRASEVLLRRNIVTGATVMFRKKLLELASPFPASWLHDEWLALIASVEGRIKLSSGNQVLYRQHSSNQVGLRKLGLKHQIGRMLLDGKQRNLKLLNRACEMNNHHFFKHNLTTIKDIAVQKYRHELVRSAYPENRVSRILPILREIQTGRYSTFGLGLSDILRDLLQNRR
ncbi:glycosyltransferase involved in cell wall biosynthesis [Aurantimicrobium minutum]|uniref:glycosyltransferase family 2 protein n=1 Tax=Aurantimicrobium minutum TaxID=708131 RepID=UPI002406E326|nr:glycosyltransferase family 2 protein [Aurantimicrobium minutum]MDF9810476.1 glycosyltransferase involved in cell wall biosynthesis [Aurantimicrobium minutum]